MTQSKHSMNKRGEFGSGLGIDWYLVGAVILLILAMALIMFIFTYEGMTFESGAEEKCQEAGMDLFDSAPGGMFTSSSITCINPKTKEVVKVR